MTQISTWIDEYHKGSRFGLNGDVLIKQKSKYQEIIVIENEYYGRALMLDGCWMTSLKDEKYYHECLVHPALSSIDQKSNVLIIGGGDGGTARECNKYSEIYNELLGWYKKGKLNNKEDISHGIETAPKSLVKLLNGSNLGKQLVKV